MLYAQHIVYLTHATGLNNNYNILIYNSNTRHYPRVNHLNDVIRQRHATEINDLLPHF